MDRRSLATPLRIPYVEGAIALELGTFRSYAMLADGQTSSLLGRPIPAGAEARWLRDARELVIDDSSSTCVAHLDGEVRCWGGNRDGELGDGTFVDRATPTAVLGVARARHVAGHLGTICATLEDHTARCWGWNVGGSVGDGTTDVRATPVEPIGLTGVDRIAVGGAFACALTTAGAVWCWGSLRLNPFFAPSAPGSAVLEYGPRPVPIAGLDDVVQIGAGDAHVCVLRRSGAVWCWGDNQNGELGDGTTIDRSAPVRVAL